MFSKSRPIYYVVVWPRVDLTQVYFHIFYKSPSSSFNNCTNQFPSLSPCLDCGREKSHNYYFGNQIPFYCSWPVEYLVFSSNGHQSAPEQRSIDLRYNNISYQFYLNCHLNLFEPQSCNSGPSIVCTLGSGKRGQSYASNTFF